MTRPFAFLLLAGAVLLVTTAAAAQSRVVVMGAPGARDAVATALRVELASRGTEVLTADPPLGDTRVGRAASAQASARASGADAAVWTDSVDEGGGAVTVVRVAPAADSEVRDAPLAAGADARVIAVVAASLLAELLAPPDAPVAPTHVDVNVHTTVDVHVGPRATPATPGTSATTPTSAPVTWPATAPVVPVTGSLPPAPGGAAAERPARADVALDGGAGLGGTGFVNDVSAEGGGFVRGALGVRLGGAVRLGLDLDLLGMWEHEAIPGFRWSGRLGASIEVLVPIGDVTFRIGAHLRALASATWQYSDARTGTESVLAGGVSGGGSLALSIPLREGVALDVALELDGMARDVRGRTPWFVPALVVGVQWS